MLIFQLHALVLLTDLPAAWSSRQDCDLALVKVTTTGAPSQVWPMAYVEGRRCLPWYSKW